MNRKVYSMDKRVIVVIIVIVILVSFGLYLGGFYFGPKAFQYKQKNSIEVKEENKTEAFPTKTVPAKPTITTTLREYNFSKSGNLVNKDGVLNLLYDEPGKLALVVILKFNSESICDLGQVDTNCDLSKLEDGLFVTITGQQNDNEVEVYKLQEQKIN